jgi:ApbE superfamily uncharacterized protein (UPF0280 family)
MPVRERKKVLVEVAVDDWVLRIWARRSVLDEARVASLRFAEELASYAIRDPGFKRARRPIPVPQDAPPIIREMARLSALAGVGPAFTFRGALLDYVGLALAQDLKEVSASCGGDHFVLAGKPGRLALPGNRKLALIVPAELGFKGIHTEIGRSEGSARGADILAVVAESCILADAVAAAATTIMARRRSLHAGLAFLKAIPGIHGAVVVQGTRIGLAGNVELAA